MKHLALALWLLAGPLVSNPVAAQSALPFNVGGQFSLVDQHGGARTQADPDGLPQLLFFGYANCPGICSAALPLMADVVTALAKDGIALRPVMITVDPARDTVVNMGVPLKKYHEDLVGLTGDATALDRAYKAFSVDHAVAYEDPEYGTVYTHGSMIYLLDARGEVLTLIPPVMDAAKAAEVALTYLRP
ncbi:MAG: SCO family protein [Sulfitobacter sp.]